MKKFNLLFVVLALIVALAVAAPTLAQEATDVPAVEVTEIPVGGGGTTIVIEQPAETPPGLDPDLIIDGLELLRIVVGFMFGGGLGYFLARTNKDKGFLDLSEKLAERVVPVDTLRIMNEAFVGLRTAFDTLAKITDRQPNIVEIEAVDLASVRRNQARPWPGETPQADG